MEGIERQDQNGKWGMDQMSESGKKGETRREEKMDAMEVKQVNEQEKEIRKSLQVLDQNVMKGSSEDKEGAKTKNW